MKQSRTLLTMVLAVMTATLIAGCDGFEGDSAAVANSTVSISSATATDTFSAVVITIPTAVAETIGATEVAAIEISPILTSMDYILVSGTVSAKAAGDTTLTVCCDASGNDACGDTADVCTAIPANTELFVASSVPTALVTAIEAEEVTAAATCDTAGGCYLGGDTVAIAEDASGTATVAEATVTAPTCGDGWICGTAGECTTGPSSGVEVCDNGTTTNSDTIADACRTTCAVASCGDGVTDTGEACDAGTSNIAESAWDGTTLGLCSTTCSGIGCGNGTTDSGEDCDDGNTTVANGTTDTCDSDCSTPACGNGVVSVDANDLAEACDDGNSLDTDMCVSGCVVATCGDGYTCSGAGCTTGPSSGVEGCDNGSSTNSNTVADACRTDCASASCGDGVIDTGETCDNGSSNSDTTADACRVGATSVTTACTAASCGDGVIDAGETCDNGSSNSNSTADACRSTCVVASCGDSVVDAGEACEVGVGTATSDTCVSCAALTSWCTTFDATEAITGVEALQLIITYPSSITLSGEGTAVDCTGVLSGMLVIFNDVDASRELNWGYTALTTPDLPATLFTCTTVAGSAPATSDFTVVVDDQSTSSGTITAAGITAASVSGACD